MNVYLEQTPYNPQPTSATPAWSTGLAPLNKELWIRAVGDCSTGPSPVVKYMKLTYGSVTLNTVAEQYRVLVGV